MANIVTGNSDYFLYGTLRLPRDYIPYPKGSDDVVLVCQSKDGGNNGIIEVRRTVDTVNGATLASQNELYDALMAVAGPVTGVGGLSNLTVTFAEYTDSGTITAGKKGVSAVVVGQDDVTINGIVYRPGDGFTWPVISGYVYNTAITYDATGSKLRVEVIE